MLNVVSMLHACSLSVDRGKLKASSCSKDPQNSSPCDPVNGESNQHKDQSQDVGHRREDQLITGDRRFLAAAVIIQHIFTKVGRTFLPLIVLFSLCFKAFSDKLIMDRCFRNDVFFCLFLPSEKVIIYIKLGLWVMCLETSLSDCCRIRLQVHRGPVDIGWLYKVLCFAGEH